MSACGFRCILSPRLTTKRASLLPFRPRITRSLSDSHGSVLKSVRENRWAWSHVLGAATVAVAGISCVYYLNWGPLHERSKSVFLPQVSASEEDKKDTPKLTRHEKRYREFASVVYKGEHYMTLKDFVESVMEDEPQHIGIQYLDDQSLLRVIKKVPPLHKGSPHFLREIWNDGILTYADYVFLLTALEKPRRQFEIVFRMIDVDSSDTIDIKEFEQMQRTVSRGKVSQTSSKVASSTLTAHLFGTHGKKKLSSDDLFQFIDNLQTEVREIEFNKHSLDGTTITAEEFAKILLSHTNYDKESVNQRLQRDPPICSKGITFGQFRDFCALLNALEDFSVAMTMYTIAGKALNEEEFARAAQVSLGKPLDKVVIKTVFRIFDIDGDAKLSQKEFLHVMKNWKIRGMKMKQTKHEGPWSEFKACIRMEMKNQ